MRFIMKKTLLLSIALISSLDAFGGLVAAARNAARLIGRNQRQQIKKLNYTESPWTKIARAKEERLATEQRLLDQKNCPFERASHPNYSFIDRVKFLGYCFSGALAVAGTSDLIDHIIG
jgi:hypothetical protein